MALATSGSLSIGTTAGSGTNPTRSINLELGRSATATSSLGEADLRTLAGSSPNTTISMSEFYGKSAFSGDKIFDFQFRTGNTSYRQASFSTTYWNAPAGYFSAYGSTTSSRFNSNQFDGMRRIDGNGSVLDCCDEVYITSSGIIYFAGFASSERAQYEGVGIPSLAIFPQITGTSSIFKIVDSSNATLFSNTFGNATFTTDDCTDDWKYQWTGQGNLLNTFSLNTTYTLVID
jgi:hypothetical protein